MSKGQHFFYQIAALKRDQEHMGVKKCYKTGHGPVSAVLMEGMRCACTKV